ncbi:hypothetical protein GCM10027566_27000 [Arachidicoccus ginsenosidivorans]|jgi:hypothetical protein
MKKMNKKYLIFLLLILMTASFGMLACNKVDYPAGLPEYDNYYYVGFMPWNNKPVSVDRSQTSLLALPVQFHSAFTRNYDAVAHYKLDYTGITDPAKVGVDFDIVDKSGSVLKMEGDSVYTMTFPEAKEAYDTIYVKLLHNSAQGTRTVNINLSLNETAQYTVGIFSQAFSRPIQIQ